MKNVDEPKAPPTSRVDNKLPEKQKPVNVDSKPSTKKPDIETDVPVTKNIPETKAPDLKKVDSDLPEGHIKKVDGDVEKTKNKQVADGEKPPKSEVLEDNPNLKEKELDNFKKYEDDVDASTKKKAKEDADAEAGKGKDRDSKAKAIAMAKIIVEANDKIDTPIPLLLAELAPLKAMKGVKNFKAESRGNGQFEIYLIASKIKLDDYDIDPESEGGDKEKTSDQTNNLDDAKEIIENEWDVMTSNLKYDKGAHDLAEEIGGVPQATFRNDPKYRI